MRRHSPAGNRAVKPQAAEIFHAGRYGGKGGGLVDFFRYGADANQAPVLAQSAKMAASQRRLRQARTGRERRRQLIARGGRRRKRRGCRRHWGRRRCKSRRWSKRWRGRRGRRRRNGRRRSKRKRGGAGDGFGAARALTAALGGESAHAAAAKTQSASDAIRKMCEDMASGILSQGGAGRLRARVSRGSCKRAIFREKREERAAGRPRRPIPAFPRKGAYRSRFATWERGRPAGGAALARGDPPS